MSESTSPPAGETRFPSCGRPLARRRVGWPFLGAMVAGGAKYLADLRLDRNKARTEARIAARLVYDDLAQVAEAVSDAHFRVDVILRQVGLLALQASVLEGDEQIVRVLERDGITEIAGVSMESHAQHAADVAVPRSTDDVVERSF